jgi:hypothetical protein
MSQKCQQRSIANFHLSQIQIASGQDPYPGELTSALSRAEVISRPPILNLSADHSKSRSASIYDSPSTAHLAGLQAPAMRSVHASLDHIATAVISV